MPKNDPAFCATSKALFVSLERNFKARTWSCFFKFKQPKEGLQIQFLTSGKPVGFHMFAIKIDA